MQKENTKKQRAWPTKDAMEQVYEMNLWGGQSDYYSGEGSHNPEITRPYLNVVISFLSSFTTPLVVCDLGCGDFNIGKELVPFSNQYYAIDIVATIIKRNKRKFNTKKITFDCLDISKDILPDADCVILRQVLQHLSNAEVLKIVSKLYKYKYVILTEHTPLDIFQPNIDIISGQGIRLKKDSGLDILAPPFNFKVKKQKELVTTILKNNKGLITTTLYSL